MHHENKKRVLLTLHYQSDIGNLNQAYTVVGARRKMQQDIDGVSIWIRLSNSKK